MGIQFLVHKGILDQRLTIVKDTVHLYGRDILTQSSELALLNGTDLMDAVSMVCNILGQYLLSTAYMEQWIFWILVNIASVVMWSVSLRQSSDPYSAIYVVKYAFYLLNSLNGLRIWIGLSKDKKTASLEN